MSETIQVSLRGARREFFLNSRNLWLKLHDVVIVQSEQGESVGRVHLKDPTLVGLKRPGNVTREIIRKATEEDLDQDDHNKALEGDAFEYCKQRIDARELKMDLTEVEAAFAGHRITFYFSAEQRVDFRELVKDLAARFRRRIELRQIGVRDEAARLSGVGRCGREYCSASWLPELRPIGLHVAKDQRLSLNPSQISGPCGRLLCCLRFEHEFYVQSRKRFPKEGKVLQTAVGAAKVLSIDIFRDRVTLRAEDGATRTVPLADLKKEVEAAPAAAAPAPEPPRAPSRRPEGRPRPKAGPEGPRPGASAPAPAEAALQGGGSDAAERPAGGPDAASRSDGERRRRRRRRNRRGGPGGPGGAGGPPTPQDGA